MNDDEEIGRRLRQLREARGLSQRELGERAGGLPNQTIDRYEKGRHVRWSVWQQLAPALGVRAELLLTSAEAPASALSREQEEALAAAHEVIPLLEPKTALFLRDMILGLPRIQGAVDPE